MRNILRYYEYKAISQLLYCVPLGLLFGFNHKAYISNPGATFGFFGYIILILVVISFKQNFVSMTKKNPVLTVSIVIFIVAFIMRYLANQLLLISSASLAGCILTMIIEPVADVYYSRAYKLLPDGSKRKIATPPLPHKTAWKAAFALVNIDEVK